MTNPKITTTHEELMDMLKPFNIDREKYPLVIVGIRNYFPDLGEKMVNDRGIYDDAIFINTVKDSDAFNGNTDPSKYRPKTDKQKGMATLNPGIYYTHKFDLHNGKYLALCQRLGDVEVTRDGNPPYQDKGYFGINIHRGGFNSTGSEGCQTVHASQWDFFIESAKAYAKDYFGTGWNKATIPYVLIENKNLPNAEPRPVERIK